MLQLNSVQEPEPIEPSTVTDAIDRTSPVETFVIQRYAVDAPCKAFWLVVGARSAHSRVPSSDH